MTNRSFTLTDEVSRFIDRQVEHGLNESASDVVQEALERLMHDADYATIDMAVLETSVRRGMEDVARGDYVVIDGPEDMRRVFREIEADASSIALKSGRDA